MFEGKKIFDISPVISSDIAVFPGDTPFQLDFLLDINKGHNLTLSKMTTTVHLGAHTDAPSHYHIEGATIESRDLNFYLGKTQVIEVDLPRGSRILPEHIKDTIISAPRILFKTKSFPYPNQWNGDFVSLSSDLVRYLGELSVILVGIDTPSVDLSDDKKLESHHAIFKYNMAVLEGIVLDDVKEGIYDLVALPLRVQGADATPVRAILIQ